MSNEELVFHCAPTLANRKVGSMFNVSFQDINSLKHKIQSFQQKYSQKNLVICLLKVKGNSALLYVYRPVKLQEILEDTAVQQFLQEFGYTNFSEKSVLAQLMLHLQESDFPHEIGVLLGYPLEDIRGFIKHKGKNDLLSGLWKVYHNVDEAKRTFQQYNKCNRVYRKCFADGFDMNRLIVAG